MPRCSRGGLTGLRLRRLISFLRRNRLYAHKMERQTGVFFDAAHLRRMLLADRCAAASSYALGFVNVEDCSREANVLNARILILRVLADFAADRARAVDALFQRLYANLHVYHDCHAIRKVLLSMRSDTTKASRLYQRIKPNAVEVIMDLVAKCPELQAKARLPRCSFDPTYYIMSLRRGLQGCKMRHKNKIVRIPPHVLARSFLQKSSSATTPNKATEDEARSTQVVQPGPFRRAARERRPNPRVQGPEWSN